VRSSTKQSQENTNGGQSLTREEVIVIEDKRTRRWCWDPHGEKHVKNHYPRKAFQK
jgi:hypothetical protein